jgi:hypothetical protein
MSAGTVTVRNETTATDIATLVFDSIDGYQYTDSSHPVFHPGDRIALSAPGDQAPAFSAHVTVPPMLAGLTPLPLPLGDPGSRPPVARGHDLVVQWTPATSGQVHVWFQPFFDNDTSPFIECSAADADGQLTFPGELLAFSNEPNIGPIISSMSIWREVPADEPSAVVAIAETEFGGEVSLE